jgi:para-aminobenzoate synthetase component 1
MLALGCESKFIVTEEKGAFQKIETYLNENKNDYVFGYLGYDLKNDLEDLKSNNPTSIDMPITYLFVPKHIGYIGETGLIETLKGNWEIIEQEFQNLSNNVPSKTVKRSQIKSTLSKEVYLEKILKIKKHIHFGDIYEANFCYAFKGENIEVNPLAVYQKLNSKTTAPFSVFAQLDAHNILSASPERFVKKTGNKITSQPIKGTIKRGSTPEEDQALIDVLANNQKDKSENIMIVDLVRNDLSKIAKPSSVKVEELCKIYTFKNIHQMISTVTAEVENKSSLEIIKALFPMGSMTGAPKIRAMQLMEDYEEHKRGLYSGCIGYFAPNGDFDFNVVIRTILYNQKEKNLSFSVGGAITDLSLPEQEYEETLLKAEALIQALTE